MNGGVNPHEESGESPGLYGMNTQNGRGQFTGREGVNHRKGGINPQEGRGESLERER